ncbi:MAG: hypothetical protein CMB80_02255 [Flammeovirgaceae bacterium]|nr:hypothetical protein [Flammeovirgaceae bacterium]
MTELKLIDGQTLSLPSSEDAAARYVADLIRNRGQVPDSEDKISWQTFAETISPKNTDLVRSSEITPLLQKSLEILIREPVEPNLVVTGLYNRVQAQGLNTQILAGAMGAVYAQDIQEHGTYPEVNFQVGGAVSTAWIGKCGIAASFTDEALRYSTWDIMSMNLRLMGNALARHKEQKAVAFLKTLGTTLFDNATPTESLYGVCTGRNLAGGGNGSLTMDNLMRSMAHMAEEGFAPDTLLMHPLFYYTFLQDPVMRAMMLAHGGGAWFNMYSGQNNAQAPWGNGAMGAQGPSAGLKVVNPGPGGFQGNGAGGTVVNGETVTGLAGRSGNSTTAPNLPSYFPFNFNIIVSPLCPYDPEDETGDVFLLSSGNVGFYLVDEDPTTVEWRDESVEVVKVKIRERYGFAVAHEGQGVGVLRNVAVAQNFWDGTVPAAGMDVIAIDADAPVV